MSDFSMAAPAEPADIVNAYRLALGREPESAAVAAERVGQPRSEWLPPFFLNDEFRGNVCAVVRDGGELGGAFAEGPPPAELRRWAAAALPLGPAGREAVARSGDWFELFHALFTDPDFRDALPELAEFWADEPLIAALAARRRAALLRMVEGAVELVSADVVRGWAVDLRDPDRLLALELRVDGRLVAAGHTGLLRRELQTRFGGEGRLGFAIPLPRDALAAEPGRPATAELREAASGVVIGRAALSDPQAPPVDAVAELRGEVAALRALLERIERRLPAVHESLSVPLEHYDGYHRSYYAPAERAVPRGQGTAEVAAVVDAVGVAPLALDATLASLHDQRLRPAELVIATVDGEGLPELDDLLARWRPLFAPAPLLAAAAADSADALGQAAARASRERLLFVPGGARLAPDAVRLLTEAVAGEVVLAFPDEDVVAQGRHSAPTFRTAYDADLMLEQDAVGACIAVRRDRVAALGLRRDRPGAQLFDLALRIAEQAGSAALAHVPRVLLHRAAAPDPAAGIDARLAAVREQRPDAIVEPHGDPLGATVPGALGLTYAVPAGLLLSVIVPTRDRLDLLAPCLASIAATASRSRARVEVLLVDNGSVEAETHDFLRSAAASGDVRVLRHPGAFNWALINNRAAEAARGEVLVFLNNDTAALSPRCWDELGGHAMRPEVGAVGARLLYEDGTIQHAGMVTDPWHSFARHEGVGLPGSDPGYRGRHALTRNVLTVTGACLATRTALFREADGFDALHFPAEGNDTDYCLRLRARGLRVLYAPAATLYHYESKSRGYNMDEASRRRAEAATAILQQRWADRFAEDPFLNPHFDRLRPPCRWLRPPP